MILPLEFTIFIRKYGIFCFVFITKRNQLKNIVVNFNQKVYKLKHVKVKRKKILQLLEWLMDDEFSPTEENSYSVPRSHLVPVKSYRDTARSYRDAVKSRSGTARIFRHPTKFYTVMKVSCRDPFRVLL